MSRGERRLKGHLAELTLVADFRDRPTLLPPPPVATEALTIETIRDTNARLERIRVAFSGLDPVRQEAACRVIEGMVVATADQAGG